MSLTDEEMKNWRTLIMAGAGIVISAIVGITVCTLNWNGYEAKIQLAEVQRATACVDAGGQWLSVQNTKSFECRRD